MFNIGDRVLNQKNRYLGKVIGYGHQLIGNVYTTTLKVLIDRGGNCARTGLVVEDLHSVWIKQLDAE